MDLNRVATFIRVVEAGSFTAAATRLQLPTSSVSRSVAKLEQELGLVLLERTTRRISLTDAGRAYYERAREAVAGLDEATALAGEAAREPSGVVHVAAPPELVGKLAVTLGEFVRLYPKIHVDVMTTARGAELVGAEVDIAIVHGQLADSEHMVRKLGTSEHRLFAAASYLERRGRPRTVADLARHDAVLYRGTAGQATWELVGPRGPETVKVQGPLSGDNIEFVLDAVAGGHGIGLLPEFCMWPGATPGVPLEPVLPKYTSARALRSLVHSSRHLPKRVALLRDFLSTHLVSCCVKPGMRPS
ncbi:LysR family transcriptional regulator [Pyxidicoccus fallax]|uniref:LysR family transcriptional regulator n=1 Tax=Pyxidicoccus fallax TaxID=394095 RepID=A0A848LVA0_9BACT|nr:LysR family transcriptional regulator [Pyxidicoccus fallax]NMO21492.1 LysR family transcriptional regulator [Pyxidicoccus fallax]NPC82769.1 LysR family transcriptional regulator [Pyxidicoccus fallax]